ncbi:GNAT family N-acetyltransferase [Anaerolineales bacterium HSG24]|nr:GNAT family N-acetyltransferase [Anaerolineales bacterium HSG24]
MLRFEIRPAVPADVPQILRFIKALAEYEKLSHEVVATEALLHEGLFGPRPTAEAMLAYQSDQPAGFVLFFHSFSTFTGRPSLYLEDLYVDEAFRGHGLGRLLLVHLAKIAQKRGCGRFEWSVLDWNKPTIAFYESLEAKPRPGWTVYQVTGEALARLAEETLE